MTAIRISPSRKICRSSWSMARRGSATEESFLPVRCANPVTQGLARADAVVLMGEGKPALRHFNGPVLRADLSAEKRFDGKRVFAFAGIGRPAKFFATLRALGADLDRQRQFCRPSCLFRARAVDAQATRRVRGSDSDHNRKGLRALAPGRAQWNRIAARARCV